MMDMQVIYAIAAMLFLGIATYAFMFFRKKPKGSPVNMPADEQRKFLNDHVLFYSRLSATDKQKFERDVLNFLNRITITPVNTHIEESDKLLIASGAIIPVFRFKNWYYYNLREVLVYSGNFNYDFETSGNNNRNILGMVGSGYMEGIMILSKLSIRASFSMEEGKSNTVIHEFVHLIDKSDGTTDGIPTTLLDKQYIIPWLDMIHHEMLKISAGQSDINPYAITNKQEFFAVASEYFFEKPDMLKSQHPKLYEMLEMVFSEK